MALAVLAVAAMIWSYPKAREPIAQTSAVQAPRVTHFSVDGHDVSYHGDGVVRFKTTEKTTGTAATTNTHEVASAKGVGLATDADQIAQNFKTDPASTSLSDGGIANAGGSAYSGTLKGLEKKTTIFYILGAGGLIFAGVFFYLTRSVGSSLLIAACSLGLIAIGVTVNTYPWVWLLGFVALVVFGGVWLYRAYAAGTLKATLATVVAGVENSEATAAAAVKESIASAAKDAGIAPKVKAIVSRIKNTL